MGIMNTNHEKKYNNRVKIIKAMAHPTRLVIIDELLIKELCVCELREIIGGDMSTISKHLTILKNARLIIPDKRGNQVFYKIEVPCVSKIIDCADNIIKIKIKEGLEY